MNVILQKIWTQSDFTLLAGQVNLPVLKVVIDAAMPLEPPDSLELVGTNSVMARWSSGLPGSVELAAADAAVAAHTGTATTSVVQQYSQLGNIDSTSSSFVPIFDVTTPALDEGNYLIVAATELFMPAVVASTFVQAEFRIGINAGATIRVGRTTIPSTLDVQSGGYDPHSLLTVLAGQKIHVILQICKLGVSAATARAANSRMSIAKV